MLLPMLKYQRKFTLSIFLTRASFNSLPLYFLLASLLLSYRYHPSPGEESATEYERRCQG